MTTRIQTLSIAIMAVFTATATTHYMVPAGTDGNTPERPYTSWATAANDLSTVKSACVSGDTILVAPGTYNADARVTDSTPSLFIRSCDPETNLPDAENTIFDGSGSSETDVWLYFNSSVSGETRLEGFTFRNFPCTAVYLEYTHSVTISGCRFENNGGDTYGGAIRLFQGYDCVITNCTFSGNHAGSAKNGGAIYDNDDSSGKPPFVVDCTFSTTGAAAKSGGAICASSVIDIRRCTFRDCAASSTGGALSIGMNAIVSECTFTGTMEATYAQAINLGGSNASVSHCVFTGLSATGDYGLIMIADGIVDSCSFVNNTKLAGGVLMVNGAGSGTSRRFVNCLVADTATKPSTLFRFYNCGSSTPIYVDNCTLINSTIVGSYSNPVAMNFRNSILVGNFGTFPNGIISYDHCGYSVDGDFVAPTVFNYRLRSTSQYVDAGTTLEWQEDEGVQDIAKRPRMVGVAVDIGCYERQTEDSDYHSILRAVASDADRTGDWADAYVGLQAAVDATPGYSLILVRSGVYDVAETIVVSNKTLEIRSVNPATGATDRDGTILDGQGLRRIMISHHGPQSASFLPSNARPVRMEGFTFRNGYTRVGDGQDFSGDGGGLLLFGRAPAAGGTPSRFVDCCFTNCTAFNGGAAAIIGGVFENCIFAGNSATETDGCGGAVAAIAKVYAESGRMPHLYGEDDLWLSPGFIGCTFTNNNAYLHGGAFAGSVKGGSYCTVYLSGCSFLDNHVEAGESSYGSAVGYTYGSLMTNCVFRSNSGANYGVVANSGNMIMSDCEFISNTAAYGAVNGDNPDENEHGRSIMDRCRIVHHYGHAFFSCGTVRNTLFAFPDSSSHTFTSVYRDGTSGAGYNPFFENCTFVRGDNKAMINLNSSYHYRPVYVNCIFCCTDGGSTIFNTASDKTTVTMTNCCLSAAIPSESSSRFFTTGNIVGNPVFRNAAEGDYYIKRSSPCREAGAKFDWMDASALDLARQPRVVKNARTLADDPSAMPDIGCYENQDKMRGGMISFR